MHTSEKRHRAVVHYLYFMPSLRRVSKLYGVSKSSLQRWVKQGTGRSRAHVRARPVSRVRRDVEACILAAVRANPFSTMQQLADSVTHTCGLRRSPRTVNRWVQRIGLTRKKAYNVVDRPVTAAQLSSFASDYLARADSEIVCIDEAGFYIGDHPRYGYAPRGQRLNIPCGTSLRRAKLSLIMAITTAGVLHFKVLDHNCRKPDFVAFIQSLPVRPGTHLLMDNIAFHHSAETRKAIADKGCKPLYIPPYSPRCNAIENVFGVLKHHYRTLCPPRVEAGFDYRQALDGLLKAWGGTSLSAYYIRVRRWLWGVSCMPPGAIVSTYDDT